MTTTDIRTPLATEIRDAMEGLAVKHLNGQVDDGWVELHLKDRRPDLDPWERMALWRDLCTAYTAWEKAEAGEVPLGPLENDLQHAEYYAERMRAALDELLDELCDGYVARTAGER